MSPASRVMRAGEAFPDDEPVGEPAGGGWLALPGGGARVLLGWAARTLAAATRATPSARASGPERRDRMVRTLWLVLERRDRATAAHCSRVARICDALADALGLADEECRVELRAAALLHDLGKLLVPLRVLNKPGALDSLEWGTMRAHSETGARLARAALPSLRRASDIIAQHHERPDGRGYPRGLGGGRVCREARIVAVADAYDAMTTDRPYRSALGREPSVAELRRVSGLAGVVRGRQFDPEIVEALVHVLASLDDDRQRAG